MPERVLRCQAGVTAIIDPPEIDPIDLAARHDSYVERQVREAAARLGITLHYVLEALNDPCSAEFDVTLHDGSTVTVDGQAAEQEQRRGEQPLLARRPRVQPSCLEE